MLVDELVLLPRPGAPLRNRGLDLTGEAAGEFWKLSCSSELVWLVGLIGLMGLVGVMMRPSLYTESVFCCRDGSPAILALMSSSKASWDLFYSKHIANGSFQQHWLCPRSGRSGVIGEKQDRQGSVRCFGPPLTSSLRCSSIQDISFQRPASEHEPFQKQRGL